MKEKAYNREKRLFRYLMLLSLIMVFLPSSWTNRVDHFFSFLLSPLSGASRNLTLAATDTLRRQGQAVSQQSYLELEEAYRASQARCVNLAEALRAQEEWTAELSGIRQDYGLTRGILIDADVVGEDSGGGHMLTLNQGSIQRIRPGQIVLGMVRWQEVQGEQTVDYFQMSVIGRIKESGMWSAKAQLLSDPAFRLRVDIIPAPGSTAAWRTSGVLQGGGKGDVLVTMVNSTIPVGPGDTVVAQPAADLLPAAMMVGTVRRCERDDQSPMNWRILVQPAVELHRLTRVVVVDMMEQQ